MTSSTGSNSKTTGSIALIILKAGLLAGSLDICFAFLYSYINRGSSPATVLQYISKVALGKTTITSPAMSALAGLLVHFTIAFVWTILFFSLYSRLKLMKLQWAVTGIVYGLFVWAMMNMVILPLWNQSSFVFKPESAVNAVILILAIGIPLSFIAHGYYTKKNTLSR
jgi:hypothetical protein